MKKIVYSLVLGAFVVAGLASCNNGDYINDSTSNANGAVNPVTPLKSSEFTWGNPDEKLSADINGAHWSADYVDFSLDSTGANVITGYKNNSSVIVQLYLRDVWGPDNVYSMEWENMSRHGMYMDSKNFTDGAYYSYLSNSGGLKMTYNDTNAIKGLFYFKAISNNGKIVNLANGIINVVKP